jgi:predicted thioesterase
MRKQVPLGAHGEAEQRVDFEHTLQHWSDELPEVYSTPHMVGLMETAAYYALRPYCEPGEVSVGTAINIEHRASATVGALVKADARLESFDGRFYVFRVTARVVNGTGDYELGRGTVSRAIVHLERIKNKLQK